ncbi:MAG: DUF4159 domain-containing protein, partial [Phycisphaerae bacterium]|nr:DUF4159 domain-containing protein [Phycisphaerae bacterium]
MTYVPIQRIQPEDVRCRKCGSMLVVTAIPSKCPKCRSPISVAEPVKVGSPSRAGEPPTARLASEKPRPAWFWPAVGGAGAVVLIIGAIILANMSGGSSESSSAPIASNASPPPPSPTPSEPVPPPAIPQAAEVTQTVPSPATTSIAATELATGEPASPFAALAKVTPVKLVVSTKNGATDSQIENALRRGVKFLESQFEGAKLKKDASSDVDRFEGLDTLCVYAILHAGLTLDDPDHRPQSAQMIAWIDALKRFPMTGGMATYARSLRLVLLALANRADDRATIHADYVWMLRGENGGAYTYTFNSTKESPTRPPGTWDNSNSQYGALGVWAAADADLHPTDRYWRDVARHWESCQLGNGWGYNSSSSVVQLSMTAAGVSILFVAHDQTIEDSSTPTAPPAPLSLAIKKGLGYLDTGDNCITLPGDHAGYTLYGLERAGLASGYKYFGKHDWYLELAAQIVAQQKEDGSWDGGDGTLAETAFRLLFLSRGRHPVFISKLRYDGDWDFRPRDAVHLTQFAGQQLEAQLNWQTVSLDLNPTDWADSPVLLISGDAAPKFSDKDIDKLRQFTTNGGMIFTESTNNSTAFTDFATSLAK